MHKKLAFLFFLVALGVNAQVAIPAITQQIISELSGGMPISSNAELIQKYPIYNIEGEMRLSMIAMVNAEFNPSQLPQGIIVGSRIENIVTLKVGLNQLEQLPFLQNVTYIESAERVNPSIQKARGDMRVDSVHQGLNLPKGYSGKDVIIGVTDWGFDYTHPMFYDTALTNSRILASWDQFKNSGPNPAGMTYGTEYATPSALAAAESDTACTYYDYATHGSHVAGIAGGGGAGIGQYGPGFESDFLFCQFYLDAGSSLDAVSWMRNKANAAGKRLVVNMSWSLYYLGPLDGTSLLSQGLDGYVNSGVVIVGSGGNNGNVYFHIKKSYNMDSISSRINFYNYSFAPMWGQSISMWGEPNHPFQAQVVVKSGGAVVSKTEWFSTTNASAYLDSFLSIGTDTVSFNLSADQAHPLNQRPHFRLRVQNKNTSLQVLLNSKADSGTVHYWNLTELSNGAGNWGMAFSTAGPGTIGGDALNGIGDPSCATEIISVAAHNSEHVLPNGTVVYGVRASFSSYGPTMDGRNKPDVSAPGMNVLSSISSYTTRSYTSVESVVFNGRTYDFDRFSGTSMSGPGVTGVVALMLEANPNLTAAHIKQLLRESARQDVRTGVIPSGGSPSWGWGKVTASKALELAVKHIDLTEFEPIKTIGLYPTIATSNIYFDEELAQEVPYLIFDMNGRLVDRGEALNSIDVTNLDEGGYLIRLYTESGWRFARFTKVLE